jgi:hypothetical protein
LHDEAALGHFDDALVTAKTMFAMSRHMGEHPTLIGDLVGIAIANVAIVPLEEMLEQPGCPNLYWALTNLPNPLVPLEWGLQGERLLIHAELHELDDRAPMSADQIKKLVAHIDQILQMEKPTHSSTREWLAARTKDESKMRAARSRLIEVGLPEERLLQFSADQIVLLDEKREYEARRDAVMKYMKLPAWQAETLVASIKPASEPALFELFVPALIKVRRAQARLEQRVALLRHVEALRIYSAEHDGRWPEKLSDLTVPLPDDPFTGKPCRYSVEGDTVHLRGSPPPGEENTPGFNVRYEIKIRK